MTVSTHDSRIVRQERDLYLNVLTRIMREQRLRGLSFCCGYCQREARG